MEEFSYFNTFLLLAILIWTLPWKAVALWRAAKNGNKKWFIAMLVLNTLAIVEIIYIFFFSKKKNNEDGHPRSY